MGLSVTTLKDILKSLLQSLQFATLFPSTVFVLVVAFVILPAVWTTLSGTPWQPQAIDVAVASGAATILLSYTLYAFNNTLIRTVEGYTWQSHPWFRDWALDCIASEKRRHKQLALNPDGDQLRALQFPRDDSDFLPTALGNVCASFEAYSSRYGIDAVVVWPRLLPFLKSRNYTEAVSQQKFIVDFMLNMLVVTVILGPILILMSALGGYTLVTALGILALFAIARLFYLGMINSAIEWGMTVRTAFDLYRQDLWDALQFEPETDYVVEQKRWRELSGFLSGIEVTGPVAPRAKDLFSHRRKNSHREI